MFPVPAEPESEAQKGQSDSTRTTQLSSDRVQSHPGSEPPDSHTQWCPFSTQPEAASFVGLPEHFHLLACAGFCLWVSFLAIHIPVSCPSLGL